MNYERMWKTAAAIAAVNGIVAITLAINLLVVDLRLDSCKTRKTELESMIINEMEFKS